MQVGSKTVLHRTLKIILTAFGIMMQSIGYLINLVLRADIKTSMFAMVVNLYTY